MAWDAPAPHGGTLVDLIVEPVRRSELMDAALTWPSWRLTPRQMCDLELLATGAFSPLREFLGEEDYASVCASMRLADGTLWPMPITLDLPEPVVAAAERAGMVALRDAEGALVAALHVTAAYRPDLRAEAAAVLGTTNDAHVFVLCRQPRVIGEICGGLLLGPTVLGALAPELQAQIFPSGGPTASWLGGTYQLGLMLLMFASRAEMRSIFRRGEGRIVGLVTLTGVVLPFLAGTAVFRVLDSEALLGKAHNSSALLLVFARAIAVTSIPVISRIMLDLGIIDTSFARIVLGVAVIEDVVVYFILALALSMVASASGENFGLPAILGLQPGSAGSLVFHVVATLVFFALVLTLGGRGFRWSRRQRWNLLASSSPIAYYLIFVFGATLVCVSLGVTPLLGAFLAGIAASAGLGPRAIEARAAITTFSAAFFVPIYFALVGLQLDLIRHFDLVFFIWFLVFACIAKSISVYLGARLAGESPHASRNLAIATNARGGPGIVLASVSFTAGIINQEFYAALVMLAIVTSLLAGSWLGRIVRRGQPLRDSSAAAPTSDRGEVSTQS